MIRENYDHEFVASLFWPIHTYWFVTIHNKVIKIINNSTTANSSDKL